MSAAQKKQQLIKTENGLVYTPVHHRHEDSGEIESPSVDYDNFEVPDSGAAARRPTSLLKKPANQFQSELSHRLKSMGGGEPQPAAASNSTATTSISSASSCASNSDLVVNSRSSQAAVYYNHRPPSHRATATVNELSVHGSKNYSLLKTTINMSQTGVGASSTLGRASKPPILKPKPRTNGYRCSSFESSDGLINRTFV